MKNLSHFAVLVSLLFATAAAQGQADVTYLWSNFIGAPGGPGNVDGTGSAARFNRPQGLAVDSAGGVLVADTANHTIRRVTLVGTNWVVSTLAGWPGASGAADGANSAARFDEPWGVAVDTNGTVFVADSGNQLIRRMTPFGTNGWQVTTLAGRAGWPGSADGTGAAATFSYPRAVALDSAGNIMVADNCTIRHVTRGGVVTTPAGSAGNCGCSDGVGGAARFWVPSALTVDSLGAVWVADTGNHVIRRVISSNIVQTLSGACGIPGCTNGPLWEARFNSPSGVATDTSGNVFVADTASHTIRLITPIGTVATVAGTCGRAGSVDGTNGAALFNQPTGIALDGAGNLYVADTFNHTIRRVSLIGTNWVTTTLAGSASGAGKSDGTNLLVRFNGPSGVAVDNAGNVYVADTTNGAIRKISSAGVATTLAGGPGSLLCANGAGSAANFNQPRTLAVDTNGNVFVADTFNCTIRQISTNGIVTTLAGQCGSCGSTNGPGNLVQFMQPAGVAVDTSSNVFVADTMNGTIRRVSSIGLVTPMAGNVGVAGTNDGPGMWASFSQPNGIAVDSLGNVYVADRTNHTIRRISSTGMVTTLAGVGGVSGTNDGLGSAARFNFPASVAVDTNGNVFVADAGNRTIRRVTSAGTVTTIGGAPALTGASDGLGNAAAFSSPLGIAVDGTGSLWVVDANENRLIRGQPSVPALTTKRLADKIVVSWPSAYKGYVLQQNTNVGNAAGWCACTYTVKDDGVTRSVSITSPSAQLVFRLVSN